MSTVKIADVSSNKSYRDWILKISHNGRHIPIKELIAISKRYRSDYVTLPGILPSQHIGIAPGQGRLAAVYEVGMHGCWFGNVRKKI